MKRTKTPIAIEVTHRFSGVEIEELVREHRWRWVVHSASFQGFEIHDTERLFVVDAFQVA